MRTRIIIECDAPSDKTPEDVRQTIANIFNAADVYFPRATRSYIDLLRAGGGVRKDNGNHIADYIEFLEFQLAQIHEACIAEAELAKKTMQPGDDLFLALAAQCRQPFEESEWRKQEYRRRTVEAAVKFVVHSSHPMREHHFDKLRDAVRLYRGLK